MERINAPDLQSDAVGEYDLRSIDDYLDGAEKILQALEEDRLCRVRLAAWALEQPSPSASKPSKILKPYMKPTVASRARLSAVSSSKGTNGSRVNDDEITSSQWPIPPHRRQPTGHGDSETAHLQASIARCEAIKAEMDKVSVALQDMLRVRTTRTRDSSREPPAATSEEGGSSSSQNTPSSSSVELLTSLEFNEENLEIFREEFMSEMITTHNIPLVAQQYIDYYLRLESWDEGPQHALYARMSQLWLEWKETHGERSQSMPEEDA